ncbi:UNVERIFIED_CONTAM: hypothetical protein FKN15_054013 [Acipenser sinensis]
MAVILTSLGSAPFVNYGVPQLNMYPHNYCSKMGAHPKTSMLFWDTAAHN